MRSEFVTVKLITDPGKITDLLVNPMSIISIVSISIPGALSGPDGEPISKKASGLDCGFKLIPVDHTEEEIRCILEGHPKDYYNSKVVGPGELV